MHTSTSTLHSLSSSSSHTFPHLPGVKPQSFRSNLPNASFEANPYSLGKVQAVTYINGVLISMLKFRHQLVASLPSWVFLIHERTSFGNAALSNITKGEQIPSEIPEIVLLSLHLKAQAAWAELDKLCENERLQPITYNHYYTDNVQNAQQKHWKRWLKMQWTTPQSRTDMENFILIAAPSMLQTPDIVANLWIIGNMDGQACAEALSTLNAYYKVILSLLVHIMFTTTCRIENVCWQLQ